MTLRQRHPLQLLVEPFLPAPVCVLWSKSRPGGLRGPGLGLFVTGVDKRSALAKLKGQATATLTEGFHAMVEAVALPVLRAVLGV